MKYPLWMSVRRRLCEQRHRTIQGHTLPRPSYVQALRLQTTIRGSGDPHYTKSKNKNCSPRLSATYCSVAQHKLYPAHIRRGGRRPTTVPSATTQHIPWPAPSPPCGYPLTRLSTAINHLPQAFDDEERDGQMKEVGCRTASRVGDDCR